MKHCCVIISSLFIPFTPFYELEITEASFVVGLEVDVIAAPNYGIYQFYQSLKTKNASLRYIFFLVVNRLMYPVVNGIPGSLSCIPFSKPSSGFHNDTLDSRIPIPLHGVIKEVIVQNCKRFNAMKRNKMDGNLPNTTYKHC